VLSNDHAILGFDVKLHNITAHWIAHMSHTIQVLYFPTLQESLNWSITFFL